MAHIGWLVKRRLLNISKSLHIVCWSSLRSCSKQDFRLGKKGSTCESYRHRSFNMAAGEWPKWLAQTTHFTVCETRDFSLWHWHYPTPLTFVRLERTYARYTINSLSRVESSTIPVTVLFSRSAVKSVWQSSDGSGLHKLSSGTCSAG